MTTIRLGLIGDNIAASRAPDLHHAAAKLCGLDVTYQRLVPRDLGLTFDETFAQARASGLRGLNITHPYKERVLGFVTVEDETVCAMGACNTVLFGMPDIGLNTDYTGFVSAFRGRFGSRSPGAVAMAGCGGAGRAVAFALAELGATSLALFDTDERKSHGIAEALRRDNAMHVRIASSLAQASEGANGLVNCTPAGMVGYGGNAFEGIALKGRGWIFDAVYTPIRTPFIADGEQAGVETLSGYELFLYQGIHAFELFTGQHVDAGVLRTML